MGYNILDIIDKAMNIAIKRKNIYEKLGEEKTNIPSIKVISKVLAKELNNTIEYYVKLKRVIGSIELEEIDFNIYDKMSFLISAFNNKISVPEITNIREYLNFILGLEKDLYSLLIDLQGRFVNNTSDVQTNTYKILSSMIAAKRKQIETLEKFFK